MRRPVTLRAKRHPYPSQLRLTRRRQYQCVYTQGVRVPGRHIVLFAMRNDQETARLGVTATRKVGHAAARNRAKRLVREAFRAQAERFAGWDLVVNVRRSTPERSSLEVGAELRRAFDKAVRRAARSDESR